jgi:hypothetical protein
MRKWELKDWLQKKHNLGVMTKQDYLRKMNQLAEEDG